MGTSGDLEDELRRSWPPASWSELPILVAVSGGADSLALLRALDRIRLTSTSQLHVAHFNHGLRGDHSDEDQRFVESLSRELGWSCWVGKIASTVALQPHDNLGHRDPSAGSLDSHSRRGPDSLAGDRQTTARSGFQEPIAKTAPRARLGPADPFAFGQNAVLQSALPDESCDLSVTMPAWVSTQVGEMAEARGRSLPEHAPLPVTGPEQRELAVENDTSEAALRVARYAFLLDTARHVGARFVVTAHTADDQAETVLHRILRGTGLEGLSGIPRTRLLRPEITLIRPFLTVTRAQILAYLTELGQAYRHDSSNDDPRYTRNRIRGQLLPQLRSDYQANVSQSLCRLATLASETQALLQRLGHDLAERVQLQRTATGFVLQRQPLRSAEPLVVRQLLLTIWQQANWPRQELDQQRWNELEQQLRHGQEIGQRNLPGRVTCRWNESLVQIDSTMAERQVHSPG